jgi:copper chaperone CopZ
VNRPTLPSGAIVLAALLLSAPLASCQSAPRTPPADVIGPTTLTDGSYRLVVHGMSCPKCISNVELQLARIPGITRPEVDMKNGVVTVKVDGNHQPSKESIAGAIADSGFTLVEIRGATE